MNKGDIKYAIDIDVSHPYLYKVEMIGEHEYFPDNWYATFVEKVFDFLNKDSESLIGERELFDIHTHIFDTVEEAINAIVSSKYGMKKEDIIKRLFR